ncbi:hypothetical protein DFQ14_102418 [Halopolyspora algeriensis]|uniref:Uncharacterized protein n=1 Tax=Halopolyspora algeriensis TaxID=1500506 RepID=A0A368VVJ3_9ACTN|nr:hypothetical protein [Halopolyspora algeriensis]RCW46116.1 hypothetical protein DFQ14_102418 [Halopolyspora algeriensis]TQM55519.1 hypothetical protein FHU43_0293 [Halopolyspora algeriensis]
MDPREPSQQDRQRPESGPLTTRVVGELPLDEPHPPAPPEPERLEVTQPYIPAISDRPPEFAKRLNPDRPPEPATGGSAVDGPTTFTPPPPAATDPPPAVEAPTTGVPTHAQGATPAGSAPSGKRRSLARRVVRRILGPDLLRKDPAPKQR